jgi:hypothetical protein
MAAGGITFIIMALFVPETYNVDIAGEDELKLTV